jgi:dihydroxyacid dehydratase/phosphogluconate dehydratase
MIVGSSTERGPLAFVRDDDFIELDVVARRLSLRVSDEERSSRANNAAYDTLLAPPERKDDSRRE